MNVPPNTRKFDINLAQQNHPLVTRAGKEAKFIAYVPEAGKLHKIVAFMLNDKQLLHFSEEGKPFCAESEWDLFLAPLGYCEGKPVFVDDVLISKWDNLQYPAEIGHENFSHCKWPSKAPVVETRMSEKDLAQVENSVSVYKDCLFAIANKAIERAILDGDVIPTSVVKSMLLSAHGDRNNTTCEHMAQITIDKYLEKLK